MRPTRPAPPASMMGRPADVTVAQPAARQSPLVVEAETPVQRVAVLQDESEALLNPVWDVARALDDDARWNVTLFGADAGETLLAAQHRFDCIVLAHNVLTGNPGLVEAIGESELVTGILLLHQKTLPGPVRLGAELVLDVSELEPAGRSPRLPRTRDHDQEVLLNWPACVGAADVSCTAIRTLVLDPASPWRVIFEVEQDGVPLPVLARSPAGAPRAVVATTMLLEPHREAHRALLVNAVTMCAAGRPDVVVAGADDAWRVTVSRKLRLRGRAAVAVPVQRLDVLENPFARWPLLGVTELVARDGEAGDWRLRGMDAWLARGGRLVEVDRDGHTHTTDAAPDPEWVARRFAEYYLGSGQADQWRESIITCRAMLRALHDLDKATRGDLRRRLGLPDQEAFVEGARALLGRRLRGGGSIEETVSTTIAALDIDRLLGGRVLDQDQRDAMYAWLRVDGTDLAGFDELVVDDQVDLARVLPEKGLLPRAVANLAGRHTPLTAAGIARLRHAACETATETPEAFEGDASRLLVQEVSNSLVVAAEYLVALARHRRRFPEAPREEAGLVDACIATIRKRGALVAGRPPAGITLKDVALEAQALTMFLRLEDTVTGALERGRGSAPAPMVDDLLRETARIREAHRVQAAELRALTIARHVLGVAVVGVAAAVLIGLLLAGTGLPDWLEAPAGTLVVLGVLVALLNRVSLCPPWLARWIDAVKRLRSSDATT